MMTVRAAPPPATAMVTAVAAATATATPAAATATAHHHHQLWQHQQLRHSGGNYDGTTSSYSDSSGSSCCSDTQRWVRTYTGMHERGMHTGGRAYQWVCTTHVSGHAQYILAGSKSLHYLISFITIIIYLFYILSHNKDQ